jgi:hypothetical protein
VVVEAQADEQACLEEIQDEEDDILTEDLSPLQGGNHKFIHQQGKEYRHDIIPGYIVTNLNGNWEIHLGLEY